MLLVSMIQSKFDSFSSNHLQLCTQMVNRLYAYHRNKPKYCSLLLRLVEMTQKSYHPCYQCRISEENTNEFSLMIIKSTRVQLIVHLAKLILNTCEICISFFRNCHDDPFCIHEIKSTRNIFRKISCVYLLLLCLAPLRTEIAKELRLL